MNGGFTLPPEQIQEWGDALRRNEQEIARLRAERVEILDKIHAARKLFGPEVFPDVPAEPAQAQAKQPQQTIIGFIEERVERAETGITLAELAAALKASELRERFLNSPNAIYTSVGRLVDKGKAFRVDRVVYSPTAYQRLSAGEIPDRNEKQSEQTLQGMILAVLRASEKALTSGEILDEIRKDAGQAARLAVRPQLGYNAIARLFKKGKLRRDGKLYRIADDAIPKRASGWTDASLFEPSE